MESLSIRENGARMTWPRRLLGLGRSVAFAVLAAMLMRAFVVQAFYIPSGSMEPTLEPGDFILVNRLVYHLQPPRRGDIIVFPFPKDEHWDFVKRVIGVPGDMLEERDGHLWVNGQPLRESYLMRSSEEAMIADMPRRRVPANRLFVLGDNRDASLDSRYWGTVDAHKVIGKAFLIYWSHGGHWWNIRWDRIGHWLR